MTHFLHSKETIEHVDAILKLMSVLTKDERFTELQGCGDKEATNMCEVLDKAINKGIAQGIAQGIEQGIEQGIKVFVETLRSLNQTDEFIFNQLIEKYHLTKEKAEQYLK